MFWAFGIITLIIFVKNIININVLILKYNIIINTNMINKLHLFKDKTIIITGHTGFKGSWLAIWLTYLGAKVVGISNDIPTQPSNFKLNRLQNKIKHFSQNKEPQIKKLKKFIKKN